VSLEYHAWVVLATSVADRDDGEWDRAGDKVNQLLTRLRPEDGHRVQMSEASLCPTTVCISGFDVGSTELVKEVLLKMPAICDASYGELVVFSWPGPGRLPDAERFVLTNGKLVGLPRS